MNAYQATMKAADWIEKNPQLFDFNPVLVPDRETQGCALGWIAHFRGQQVGWPFNDVKTIGVDGGIFYERMRDVCSEPYGAWKYSAALCADTLRLYAAKYLKPEATTPDWLAIATATNAYKPAEIVT